MLIDREKMLVLPFRKPAIEWVCAASPDFKFASQFVERSERVSPLNSDYRIQH